MEGADNVTVVLEEHENETGGVPESRRTIATREIHRLLLEIRDTFAGTAENT